MHKDSSPVFKDIVLAGGGHTHSLLIRQWGMDPLPGVRLTLVSPQALTPYSGMLPGLIAGHYSFEDIHVDLVSLCQWANVRLIMSEVTGIDPDNNTISLRDRPDLSFDVLSLDTGSTPNHVIPGSAKNTIPIKPIAGFWQHWNTLYQSLQAKESAGQIAIVGGGAGAVETVLAMAWACKNNNNLKAAPEFYLVYQGNSILSGFPKRVVRIAMNAFKKLGIQLLDNFSVSEVFSDRLAGKGNKSLSIEHVFWCVQASAAGWLAASGLACNEEGFVEVNRYLQCTNNPNIFAAGDIAHMVDNPRPKAGVYAVRQAPYLFSNLRNFLLKTPLLPYIPQDRFLSLLALGEKTAAGNRGLLAFSGSWVWRWKDRIDRKFMDQFHGLSDTGMQEKKQKIPASIIPEDEKFEKLSPDERCGGCGAKVGGKVLAEVLTRMDANWQIEDASIVSWPDSSLVQTVDLLSAPFDDPWLLGRIAVFHALNDLLAMNAVPHSIQLVLTMPFAARIIQARELTLVMEGVSSACQEEGVTLLGGHSAEGHGLSVCITANGIPGNSNFSKQGAQKGDLLATNKALGTGIILAGHMHGYTPGVCLAETLSIMNTSNKAVLPVLSQAGVHSCTDISGFGLLGHLSEMLAGSDLGVQIELDKIPVQAGVQALLERGVRSSLLPQNEALVKKVSWVEELLHSPLLPVLLDPQTSGGLLFTFQENARARIETAGFSIIGQIG